MNRRRDAGTNWKLWNNPLFKAQKKENVFAEPVCNAENTAYSINPLPISADLELLTNAECNLLEEYYILAEDIMQFHLLL